ncbi:phage tail tape measure protein [Myroides marinus]|uniref:phage tail tape measure protein n=1 Tax=Myroides marinus TaxID=703342 RepID=UPI0025754A10|nr:phage tail tape measure protein [Myroides marinus]MDM1345697.1 phage tail tape measure protein [Myroides marinus]
MASLAQINVLFRADLDQFSSEMQNAQRELQKTGKKMQEIGAQMSTYLTAPLVAIGAFSSKISMDFDDSMRKVMATTNATEAEFKSLTATAEEMGAKTRYTASQSAEAMNYMALAGWKSQQIIEGIPGVLALAAASGEDLGMVADILTDGLTAMGKGAEQASQFVDVLAASASNSNTTVGMMGQAFQYAAPLAGAFGYEVEDLALAIGLMANAGIKGEKAGTALRALMTRMVKPTREAQKAMTDLGLEVKNTDGSMKPLGDVIDQLRTKFSGLTDAQKGQYAGMLAGQEAISGLLAIVNAAPADFDKLSKAVENSAGTAKRMQDQMEGGIGGAWREMSSAIEGVAIQIGQVLEPAFRGIVTVIKDLSNAFMGLSDTSKTVIVVIGGIVSAIGPLLVGYGTVLRMLPQITKSYIAATASLKGFYATMLANPITTITVAIGILGAAIYAFTREASEASRVQKTLSDVTKEAQKSIAGEKAQLDTLLKTARDETLSKKQREEAIKKLNALSPQYLKSITLETVNTKEATKAIDEYVKALSRKAMEQAALSKKTELYQKQIDVQMSKAGESGFVQDMFDKLWKSLGYGSDVVIKNSKDLEDYIKQLGLTGKQAEGVRATYAPYLKQKEKEIALIEKQVGALDDLIKAQGESAIPVTNTGGDTGIGGGLDLGSGSGDKGDKFLKGSVAFYEAQIKGLEEMRANTALSVDEYAKYADAIDAVQKKIDSLSGKRETATSITIEDYSPAIEGSTLALERQKKALESSLEGIRLRFGEASDQYKQMVRDIQDIDVTIKANVDMNGISTKGFEESLANYKAGVAGLSEASAQVSEQERERAQGYAQVVGDVFGQMGSSISSAMGQSSDALTQFGGKLIEIGLKSMAIAMSQSVGDSVVVATNTAKGLGPVGAYALPALIAASMAAVMSANSKVPKFANGGIVSGPTFGLMGEYAGAANNPEVIAPLNKLKDLIEPAGGSSNVHVTVGGGFEIDGTKLRLVLDRTATRSKRIG